MSNLKKTMEENPLARVYLTVIPALAVIAAVIFILVKVISGIIAPDQLVLNATYHDFEQGAVLKTPVRVAKDEAFEKEVKNMADRKSGFMEILVFFEGTSAGEAVEAVEEEVVPENGSYTFTYEKTKLPETIYVKAPEWWYPVNTDGNMMVPLKVGAETADVEGYGSFQITNVETVKISTGIFNVNVTMTSAGDAVPSNVKLVMEDEVFEEWSESSDLSYNEETGFAERTIVFRYNRSLREDISDLVENATVMVQEYTVCKTYTEGEITSNIEGLQIVQVDD